MIDESFHLTPLDVRRTEFPAALRGYDKARVDEFRERVAHELERITRVNTELDNKAKGFHEQLKAFRERDKALNEALVSAQQLRAETRTQAEREAALILREARAEGERLIDSTKAEARRLSAEIEALERSRRAYLAQLRSLVSKQLHELDAIPSLDATRPEVSASSTTVPIAAPHSPAPPAPPVAPSSAPGSSAEAVPAPGSVVPKTTTVPLTAVNGNGEEAQPGGAKDKDDPRSPAQTPVWLKAVPSKE